MLIIHLNMFRIFRILQKEPAILVKMTVEFNVYQKVTDYTGNVTPPKSIHVYDYVASTLGVLPPR